MDHTVPVRFSGYAAMDIGRDNGGVVDLSYDDRKPFPFTGTVKKVVFDIKTHLTQDDEHQLHAGGAARAHRSRSLGLSRFAHRRKVGSMAFDDETIDVLIGGYLSKDAAMEDYESVLGCGGYLHGAVVVSKDLEGNLAVEQTDHLVREGAAGLGAIGFAVGLFAPPLLAATAVGGVIGAGRRQTAPQSHRREAAGAGRGDHPARRRRADRGLPALRSRAGRARRDAGRLPASSVRPKATTSRRSRAPSPTPRPRWRSPRADVLPVASPSRGRRPSTSSQQRGGRRGCPTQAHRPTSEHTCRSQAGHRPDPTIRSGPEQYQPDHQRPCEPCLFVLREDAENYVEHEPRDWQIVQHRRFAYLISITVEQDEVRMVFQ